MVHVDSASVDIDKIFGDEHLSPDIFETGIIMVAVGYLSILKLRMYHETASVVLSNCAKEMDDSFLMSSAAASLAANLESSKAKLG